MDNKILLSEYLRDNGYELTGIRMRNVPFKFGSLCFAYISARECGARDETEAMICPEYACLFDSERDYDDLCLVLHGGKDALFPLMVWSSAVCGAEESKCIGIPYEMEPFRSGVTKLSMLFSRPVGN